MAAGRQKVVTCNHSLPLRLRAKHTDTHTKSHREPAFAARLSASLEGRGSLLPALGSLRVASHSLSAAGFDLPAWQDLSRMPAPHSMTMTQAPTSHVVVSDPRSRAIDDFADRTGRREIGPASAAMLDSQAGPGN